MTQGTTNARRATPGRHVYDVIVIGGQLSGALAAALSVKRGLQTLYVPHDSLGDPFTHQGVELRHVPFLVPPLKAVPALEASLAELGLTQVVGRSLRPVPLQLLEQTRWFELSHDEKHRGPELARALGADAEAFDEQLRKAQAAGDPSDAFFQAKLEFPPEGFFGKWKFKRQLGRFQLDGDTPLADDALLRKLARFVACVDAPAPMTRARVLGRVLAGPDVHEGGREGLWRQLIDRARELGADVLTGDEFVESLTLDGGPGVRLSRGEATYRAGFVLAAMDLDALTRLMPEKARKAAAKFAAPAAQKALCSFHLHLPESALPRGLGPLALLDAPSLEGGAALLEVRAGANADSRLLVVTVEAPVALRAGGEPAVKALLEQVYGALERVMPFTRPHVAWSASTWTDAQHVVGGRGEPHPLFTLGDAAWLGVSGTVSSSPWKRVLLAGRQVLPGLGLEGEVLAAQRAVHLAELTLKKNDPLKQRRTA
ncbi:MAG: desaturase [Myxococcaceae bacterium]